MVEGPDYYLRLPSARFSQEQTVLPPVIRGWRSVMGRLVQVPFALGQAVDDILEGGLLEG